MNKVLFYYYYYYYYYKALVTRKNGVNHFT